MHETTGSLKVGDIVILGPVSQAYSDHLRLLGRSAQTIRARTNGLRQFGKFWGDRDLREATTSDLEIYARSLRERVSRETVFVYLDAVRGLCRFLADEQAILLDPSRGLPLPRRRTSRVGKSFTPEEMKRLLESLDVTTADGTRARALLETLYSTGLRSCEARRLAVGDLGNDSLAVRGGKGGKDRIVPLGKKAREWLDRYLADVRSGLARPEETALWISRNGRPFGDVWFRRYVSLLGIGVGLAGVTCHAIRRSLATHLLAAGANPTEVAAILGHGNLESLGRYATASGSDLKTVHARTHPREVQP